MARTAVLAALWALTACAAKIPEHDGYPKAPARTWEKPTALAFDEDLEAESDGELSYPDRKRARWFAVDLPEDGKLEIELAYAPLGDQDEEEDEEDPFDLAFEVYDANYRMLVRANNEEEDAGERKKTRMVDGLAKGRYLIHVYLQRRIDAVEYNLHVQLRRGAVEATSDFPRMVAFVDELPQVPTVDDAPAKCRGARCGGKPEPGKPPRRDPDPRPDKEEPEATPLSPDVRKGRITGVRAVAGGTRITINRGQTHGITKGMKGRVVSKSGAGIPNGGFTIDEVKTNESYATVQASTDAVTGAANVVLSP